jgi:hypothetical protein
MFRQPAADQCPLLLQQRPEMLRRYKCGDGPNPEIKEGPRMIGPMDFSRLLRHPAG